MLPTQPDKKRGEYNHTRAGADTDTDTHVDTIKQKKGKSSDLLLSRALHVLTLQLHGLPPRHHHHQTQASEQSNPRFQRPNAEGEGEGDGDVDGGARRKGVVIGTEVVWADDDDDDGGETEAFFEAIVGEGGVAGQGGGGGGKGKGDGQGGEGGGGHGGQGEGKGDSGTSVCELLGKVARDHGVLGVLFEDGLQVKLLLFGDCLVFVVLFFV